MPGHASPTNPKSFHSLLLVGHEAFLMWIGEPWRVGVFRSPPRFDSSGGKSLRWDISFGSRDVKVHDGPGFCMSLLDHNLTLTHDQT